MREHCTAQDGLAGQPPATAGQRAGHAGADHTEQLGVFIGQFGSAFQSLGDRMDSSTWVEYAGLSGAIETHRDLQCLG